MDEKSIKLKSGADIKGFSSNYSSKSRKMSFIVVRYRDERSSEICKRIEEMSLKQGGIVLGNNDESQELLEKAFSSDYRTELFHKNCRCRLVPKPKSMTGPLDDFDLSMIVNETAISYSSKTRLKKNLKEEHYAKVTSAKFKKRISTVVNTNASGAHYKHLRKRGSRK